jgi:hypothetical protein
MLGYPGLARAFDEPLMHSIQYLTDCTTMSGKYVGPIEDSCYDPKHLTILWIITHISDILSGTYNGV